MLNNMFTNSQAMDDGGAIQKDLLEDFQEKIIPKTETIDPDDEESFDQLL
jgi:hypothetical protein